MPPILCPRGSRNRPHSRASGGFVPHLHPPTDPARLWGQDRESVCYTCATLLAALDGHPRVVMSIVRHAQIDVTMNLYTEVSDAKTLQALKRLGKQLGS